MAEELIIEDDEYLNDDLSQEDDLNDGLEDDPKPDAKDKFDPKKIDEMLEASKRQEERIEALARETDEAKRAAEFWVSRAKNPEPEKPAAKPKPTADELMDALSTDGLDALQGHFVSREELETIINQRASKMQITDRHQKLLDKHDGLKDKDSDFSKRVTKVLQEDYDGLIHDQVSLLAATEKASERVAREIERQTGERRGRQTAAGAHRGPGGSGAPPNSKVIVLNADQRLAARKAGVSEADFIDALRNIQREQGR